MVLVVLVGAGGAKKRGRHETPAPPPISTIRDADLRTPPLDGATSLLGLEDLVVREIYYDLALDRRWLARAQGHEQEVLEALAADPRWRVGQEGAVVVAVRREHDGSAWTVGRTGYHGDGSAVWRTAVRFADWPAAMPWGGAEQIVRVEADDRPIKLGSYAVPGIRWEDARATALSVSSSGVGLDLYELGPTEARRHTADGFRQAAAVVGAATAVSMRKREGRSVRPVRADGEPNDDLGVEILSPRDGWLEVRARANPGGPGWTWVRLVVDGAAWAESEVGAGTRERIGHSPDANEGWYLQGRFPVPSGEAFEAVAQVWHVPDGDGPIRPVLETPVTVPAR